MSAHPRGCGQARLRGRWAGRPEQLHIGRRRSRQRSTYLVTLCSPPLHLTSSSLPTYPAPPPCRSTGISLYYQMAEESLKGFNGDRHGNDFLVNLIDSPGG